VGRGNECGIRNRMAVVLRPRDVPRRCPCGRWREPGAFTASHDHSDDNDSDDNDDNDSDDDDSDDDDSDDARSHDADAYDDNADRWRPGDRGGRRHLL
jgi:hypothetical protein